MGLKTIAEFVEDEATERLLKQMHVDFAQGYYYGAPQPLNQQAPQGHQTEQHDLKQRHRSTR
jgi:EAL domain-containing protein (putative c-di-GMP-specific phosphodiesterase class I)